MREKMLNDELHLFRDMVRTFIKNEIVPNVEEWSKAGMVSRDIWRKAGNKAWHLSIYYQGRLDNYLLKHASSTRIDCRADGGYKVYI